MRNWYLVSYDVRDDKRLRAVARKLEGYGQRIQFSVFRCQLNDRTAERLRWELAKILSPEDSLLIIPLCARCAARLRSRSGIGGWLQEAPRVHIV